VEVMKMDARKHGAYARASIDNLRRIRALWVSATDVLEDLTTRQVVRIKRT
jgi:hypothetical protein